MKFKDLNFCTSKIYQHAQTRSTSKYHGKGLVFWGKKWLDILIQVTTHCN